MDKSFCNVLFSLFLENRQPKKYNNQENNVRLALMIYITRIRNIFRHVLYVTQCIISK